MKTIKELNEKPWYRFVKVVYILFFVLIYGLILIDLYSQIGDLFEYRIAYIMELLGMIIIPPLLFELFKRLFYYIFLGKLFPKE